MAQIKAKQLKLAAQGDLIIGDASANGSILSIGAANQVVISNATTGAWGYLGQLRDIAGVVIVDTTTTVSQVNNLVVAGGATGTGPEIEAVGSDTNIDINLTIKGSGEVLVPVSYTVVSDNALTTKQYVDGVATGLDFKNSVRAGTVAPLPGTLVYSAAADTELAGAQPWTSTDNTLTIDGVVMANGDRILVKDEGDPAGDDRGHGIFTVTGVGSNIVGLIRADDADNTPINEVSGGMFTFAEEGATQADTGWVASSPDGLATLGTSDIIMVQFSAAGVISPGFGLSQVGTDFNVNVDDITTTIGGVNDVVVGHDDATDHSNQVLLGQDATGGPATAVWGYVEDLRDATTGDFIIDGVNVASSVNFFTVTNAATGSPVLINSTGTDANIDLELTAKGTGRLKLDGTLWPNAGVAARSVLVTQDGAADDLVAVTAPDASGNQVLIYDDATNTIKWDTQAAAGTLIFSTITGDTGSATADNSADTLKIAGGEGVVTIATDDPEVLTIDLDINGLITITPAVDSGDSFVIYDVSTASHVQVTVNQFFDDLDIGVVKYDDASATGGANEAFVVFFTFTPLSDAVVTVFFNGLALRDTGWTRVGTTLTLVDSVNGYATESGDIVSARYETAP